MARGESYEEFVKKFERKKTTDDCETPQAVYSAVLEYCINKFNINPQNVVRPFWPNTEYRNFNYTADSVVVDNPPFSILTKIIDWYLERDIKFFLFAPTLTLFFQLDVVMFVLTQPKRH